VQPWVMAGGATTACLGNKTRKKRGIKGAEGKCAAGAGCEAPVLLSKSPIFL